jgi:hypothetical protein
VITRYVLSGIRNPELTSDSTLHVIGVVSNPARYHSRYKIFREWAAAMVATKNVVLHVAELAFGDRQFEVTGDDCPTQSQLQLRSSAELWHKENLINLAAQWLLPRDWRYVAWVDADVWFNRPDWALETIHQLQHYAIVQPWSECADEGPHSNTMQMYRSFCSQVAKGVEVAPKTYPGYPLGHSGFAWACTRTFWENTRGLVDFSVLGSADYHMAWGAVGRVDETIHGGLTTGYADALRAWARRANRETHGTVGYVPGTLSHRFHGAKRNRHYQDRWKILVDHAFDPEVDLRRDAQGLLSIYGKPALEGAIRDYMRSRNEDSIDEG